MVVWPTILLLTLLSCPCCTAPTDERDCEGSNPLKWDRVRSTGAGHALGGKSDAVGKLMSRWRQRSDYGWRIDLED